MENQPIPTESNSIPTTQEQAKPTKEKKPRTEAQVAATQKALAAMTAARKVRAVKQIEKREEVKQAVKVVKDKILKEDVGLVTKNDYKQDFDSMRKELAELKAMYSLSQQKPVTKPQPERIVERVIERVPTPTAQPQKLSGHALLDSIFFK